MYNVPKAEKLDEHPLLYRARLAAREPGPEIKGIHAVLALEKLNINPNEAKTVNAVWVTAVARATT